MCTWCDRCCRASFWPSHRSHQDYVLIPIIFHHNNHSQFFLWTTTEKILKAVLFSFVRVIRHIFLAKITEIAIKAKKERKIYFLTVGITFSGCSADATFCVHQLASRKKGVNTWRAVIRKVTFAIRNEPFLLKNAAESRITSLYNGRVEHASINGWWRDNNNNLWSIHTPQLLWRVSETWWNKKKKDNHNDHSLFASQKISRVCKSAAWFFFVSCHQLCGKGEYNHVFFSFSWRT